MRIDKYLWCVRMYKTRTLAASQCKLEKVWVNNELVKASREIKAGDVIKVRKGPLHFSIEVIDLPKARLGAKLVPAFARDVTPAEEIQKMEIIRMQFRNERPKGLGRPTKKERRDLDDYTSFDFEEWSGENDQ